MTTGTICSDSGHLTLVPLSLCSIKTILELFHSALCLLVLGLELRVRVVCQAVCEGATAPDLLSLNLELNAYCLQYPALGLNGTPEGGFECPGGTAGNQARLLEELQTLVSLVVSPALMVEPPLPPSSSPLKGWAIAQPHWTP